MTTYAIEAKNYQNPFEHEKIQKNNIFTEMEAIGINPDTLLEIAAHDLINQYGDNALIYSKKIEQQYFENGDEQSLQIWQRITNYLQTLNGAGSLIAH